MSTNHPSAPILIRRIQCACALAYLILARVTVLVALLICQSCYQYRVSSANFDPSTNYERKTVHSIAWGLAQKRTNGIDVVVENCDKLKINQIDEVRVTNNLGYALITVATLGFWNPTRIEWKCSKPCPREGTIP